MATPAPAGYDFPVDQLHTVPLAHNAKQPVVLVACGSFSPITFLHLRMFEMAKDYIHLHTDMFVAGGYLSPVNDAYQKKGLALAEHRINMCELAIQTSDWINVDPFEARRPTYTPTAKVLDHFKHELNEVMGGVDVEFANEWGEIRTEKRPARILLLAGSDLIQTMSEPGVWSEEDLHHILGLYGCVIISRAESELDTSIFNSSNVHSRSPLALYRHNIFLVEQLVRNDVSSTKVRLFLKKGMSVLYLIPSEVVRYIERMGLYRAGDSRKGSARDLTALSATTSISSN
ncbi:hypothetical protein MNV49_006905 [Pseudohyphozyma bogoriensis]|nr:hypothetical protein MNV49_006905 [Pseudohyphozyma bogoriensis]